MSEDENIEQRPEDGKTESPEEVSGEPSIVNGEPSTQINQSDIPQSEINMEVHHHPDLHHKRKNFREYFLEFLMIFLAVTMGFIAENIREHITERAKEKDYLVSMVAELKYDTLRYNKVLAGILTMRPILDSLYINAKEPQKFQYILQAKWNTPVNVGSNTYVPSTPTIQELKSSGNLRLIEQKELLQKIILYDAYVQNTLAKIDVFLKDAKSKIFTFEDDMCDETEFNDIMDEVLISEVYKTDTSKKVMFNMPLLVKDPVKINQLANSFVNFKSGQTGYYYAISRGSQMATELMQMIQKEYHLKDE